MSLPDKRCCSYRLATFTLIVFSVCSISCELNEPLDQTAQTASPDPQLVSPVQESADELPSQTILAWRSKAETFNVLLAPADTSLSRVAIGLKDNEWVPAGLHYGIKYRWQVEAVADSDTLRGPIWSFSTRAVQDLNRIALTSGFREIADLAAIGNFLYVLEREYGVWVLDAARNQPLTRRQLLFTAGEDCRCLNLGPERGLVVTSGVGGGVLVFDSRIPDEPQVVATIRNAPGEFTQAAAFVGHYVCLANDSLGVLQVNLDDLSDRRYIPETGDATDVISVGERLYAALDNNGIAIAHLADNTGGVDALISLHGVARLAANDLVVACVSPDTLMLVSTSAPSVLCRCQWPSGAIEDVAADRNYLYVAGSPRIQVVDISDPRGPQLAAMLPDNTDSEGSTSVSIGVDLMFMTRNHGEVQVYPKYPHLR